MKRFRSALTLSAFTLLAAMSFHSSAWAVDAASFTERLQNYFKANGWTFSSSKSENDGSDIVLHDMDISTIELNQQQLQAQQPAASQDQSSTKEPPFKFDRIEELRFKNVTEDKDGNYLAENITLPILTRKDDDIKLFIKDITFSNLKLAPGEKNNLLITYFPYESVKSGQFYLTRDDQTFLSLNQLSLEYAQQPDKKLIDFTAEIKSFNYDPEKAGDTDVANWVNVLGYNNLTGSFRCHELWDVENGVYKGDNGEIIVNNAGKLTISFGFEGVTEDFIHNIEALSDMMLTPGRDENSLAVGYLGIVQQIKFANIKIRYDDNSLTNRILDYFSKQNNVSRADFIRQIKTTLSIMGVQINYPEFVDKTTDQVETFLDNPQSITISATPDKPVPLAILMATGATSQVQLIDLLKIKIEANK